MAFEVFFAVVEDEMKHFISPDALLKLMSFSLQWIDYMCYSISLFNENLYIAYFFIGLACY